jgi:hypothetical protein
VRAFNVTRGTFGRQAGGAGSEFTSEAEVPRMEQLQRNPTRRRAEQAPASRPAAPAGRARRAGVNLVAARAVASALVIATGAIHLYLYQDGYSAVPTIGRLFLANFVVGVVLGLAILLRGRPAWSLLGAGFCLGTLGGFLVSVHWGLFGYQETLSGAWQERAAVVEVAGAIACGVVTIWTLRARPGRSAA